MLLATSRQWYSDSNVSSDKPSFLWRRFHGSLVTTQADKTIESAVQVLPEALQDDVRNWLAHLTDSHAKAADTLVAGDLAALLRTVACSEMAGRVVARDWAWFSAEYAQDGFGSLPADAALSEELDSATEGLVDQQDFARALREHRNRTLLKILWFDLHSSSKTRDVLQALSSLADAIIRAAVRFATTSLNERFGRVRVDGEDVPLVVLAMGKLGGRELNFSSDVDLVFLYPRGEETTGPRTISAHEFFERTARLAAGLLDEVTEDGFAYRVDTRLRPFGESGPRVLSFSGLESYLLQHGRGWERYAYVKARVVTPVADEAIERELGEEIIRPFVYRRYLDYGVFESLREMKALVAAEVQRLEMEDNVKLGPGGIREIEFVVQAAQLVRGGREPGLRTTNLRTALEHAAALDEIDVRAAGQLIDAYDFLRDVENRLQATRDQQIHELPTNETDRARLAYAMCYPSWAELKDVIDSTRTFVAEQFESAALRGDAESPDSPHPHAFSALWSKGAAETEWAAALCANGVAEPGPVAHMLVSFAGRPSVKRVGRVTARRLEHFVATLLGSLASRPQPARALERVLNVVDNVLRRSAYIALLNENPAALDRLVDLCDSSRYLADEVTRYPLLLDELIDARSYERAPTSAQIEREFARSLSGLDDADSEEQIEALARFKRASMFRLAVADISGVLPLMKVSDRLTQIAELILERALRIARRDLVTRFGEPSYMVDGHSYVAEFGIVAYGKLGGIELSYGSDLDLVFLHDSSGDDQGTTGAKSIDNAVFFGRLAQRLVHFLTAQTRSGSLYEVDTRLRPSGMSGLLVSPVAAFERYQREDAWTWEHQALLRARSVAGAGRIKRAFDRIRREILTPFHPP